MDEKKKKLRRMATWTTAIFATVFAVFMALFWLIEYPARGGSAFSVLGAALGIGWPIFVIAAVLCIVVYVGYSFYLNRQKT